MAPDEALDVIELVADLWPSWPVPRDGHAVVRRANEWSLALGPLTAEQAMATVRIIERTGERFAPSPSQITQRAADTIIDLPGEADTVAQIRAGINPAHRPSHPFVLLVVKAAGGWPTIGSTTVEYLTAHLVRAYRATLTEWREQVAKDPHAATAAMASLVRPTQRAVAQPANRSDSRRYDQRAIGSGPVVSLAAVREHVARLAGQDTG